MKLYVVNRKHTEKWQARVKHISKYNKLRVKSSHRQAEF